MRIAVPDEPEAERGRLRGWSASSASPTASVCLACERDSEAIADAALVAFERLRPASFAVRVRRRDKSFPLTSQQLEREIGAAVQRRTALPVNLSRPGPGAARRAGPAPRLRARSRACRRRRPSGRQQRPRRQPALRRHRLAGGGAAGDEARAGDRVRPLQRRALPGPGRGQQGAGPGACSERLPGGAAGPLWVVPFGNQQRMLSAVSPPANRIVLYRRQMARIALRDRGAARARPRSSPATRSARSRRRRCPTWPRSRTPRSCRCCGPC